MGNSNYTKPNDKDHKDSPEDWLAGALVFARALSLIIAPNDGIIVKSTGDMKKRFDSDLLLVANLNNQMVIIPTTDLENSEGFEEGDHLQMGSKLEDDIAKKESTDDK